MSSTCCGWCFRGGDPVSKVGDVVGGDEPPSIIFDITGQSPWSPEPPSRRPRTLLICGPPAGTRSQSGRHENVPGSGGEVLGSRLSGEEVGGRGVSAEP